MKKIQLNIGCGIVLLKDFINIDVVQIPTQKGDKFRRADMRDLPFEKNSVDYILMDNVLEHLPMSDVPMALIEARRVLKNNGRLVICVPEFNSIAKMWLEQGSFSPMTYTWLAQAIYGNQSHEGEFHQTPFTPEYLQHTLNMVGFKKGSMTVYEPNAEGPAAGVYPGVNDKNEKTYLRHAVIYADVRKSI